ncbi:MFS transporter [Novosphingobium taihuense]|uniref:MFS family permease n=1 Tax=Novosphingobium taihuense TaxID=260085 RepID=A0A7W7ADL3_9SPHN|nr:MFS transporter [Novosphingobium taihuense]MBB4615053.1 MFS family permease [Novosphingobium taihuense]TWH79286.1 putative MFS family arabinose efflux permease [Novosphingobium taihuense]
MKSGSSFAPLRHTVFRRIWTASLLSNFGLLINGVGAGWAMTELSGRTDLVALIQTALMLPYMLFSMAAGAISDTYDRRKVSMIMLGFAFCSSLLLTGAAVAEWLTPTLLLMLCFLTGTANAMFGPAWQASVSEQVPNEDIGPAVALNSVSYNIARSFGPAIGGLIVAAAGSVAAFGVTALCYLPILLAIFLWRRERETPRLPPERIGWAIISGVRYVMYSPTTRSVIIRSALTGIAGGSISSLMPLVARELLGGSAATYGLLLGVFGIGAVVGALVMPTLRRKLSGELHIGSSTAILGVAMILLSQGRSIWFAMPVLFVAGVMWMQPLTQFNIVIQTQAPRWVAGRALAAFQASIAGGLAGGAWLWGHVGQSVGTANAIACSGLAMLGCVVASRIWPLDQEANDLTGRDKPLATPEVRLGLTGRSGPIVVEVEYSVHPDRARQFYAAMLEVRHFRQRNGAYMWSLARDIADEQRWLERFSCPTWHDYLRQRERMTAGEQAILDRALAHTTDQRSDRIRRFLERPMGSVRWLPESRDPGLILPINPGSG